jgi:hypothetical protein
VAGIGLSSTLPLSVGWLVFSMHSSPRLLLRTLLCTTIQVYAAGKVGSPSQAGGLPSPISFPVLLKSNGGQGDLADLPHLPERWNLPFLRKVMAGHRSLRGSSPKLSKPAAVVGTPVTFCRLHTHNADGRRTASGRSAPSQTEALENKPCPDSTGACQCAHWTTYRVHTVCAPASLLEHDHSTPATDQLVGRYLSSCGGFRRDAAHKMRNNGAERSAGTTNYCAVLT